MIINRMTGSSE